MIETLAWWVVRRGRSPDTVRSSTVGRFGEWVASWHYRRRGFGILARNRRVAGVEIDLVVRPPRARLMILAEVKTSTTGISGLRRIDRGRQDRLVRAAAALESSGPLELHAVDVDLSGARPRVRAAVITPWGRRFVRFNGRRIAIRRS